MDSVHEKYRMLSDALKKTDGIAVAFSGGTDSSFLLYAAKEALGEKVLAVTAASPFVPKREVQAAKAFCETYGIRHTVIPASALNIDGLRHNPPDRCYLCKRQIMGAILEEARRQGITWVAEGANADDETQYRPGTRAVKELGVLSPLKEAGLTKAEIRQLSLEMGLPTWDKPANACLATRFLTNEPITDEGLLAVEAAEDLLHDKGFLQVRVRLHNDLVRIETPTNDLSRFIASDAPSAVCALLKQKGFRFITLDLEGYKTGNMDVLGKL